MIPSRLVGHQRLAEVGDLPRQHPHRAIGRHLGPRVAPGAQFLTMELSREVVHSMAVSIFRASSEQ